MDLQPDEMIAVLSHQALQLHRATAPGTPPIEPRLVLAHLQRMQAMTLSWANAISPNAEPVAAGATEQAA